MDKIYWFLGFKKNYPEFCYKKLTTSTAFGFNKIQYSVIPNKYFQRNNFPMGYFIKLVIYSLLDDFLENNNKYNKGNNY
jgi:hypothetical protein